MNKAIISDRQSARRFPRTGSFVFLVLACCFVFGPGVLSSCSLVSDEFPCGRRDESNDAIAKICNRPGEECVCATNRCAEPTGDSECKSQLRYTYGDRKCVEERHKKTAFSQPDAAHGFCPGEGAVLACGGPGNATCPSTEVCICATGHCARFDATNCGEAAYYAYSATNQCVDKLDAIPQGIIYPGDKNNLCPQFRTATPACGVWRSGEEVAKCSAPERCVCSKATYRCVTPGPGLNASEPCASGYVWKDATCVTTLMKSEIEDSTQQVDSDGYCPGQNPGGAGGAGGASDGGAGGGAGAPSMSGAGAAGAASGAGGSNDGGAAGAAGGGIH